MRLHDLKLSAFGPFAGTETVDFDSLTRAGIFLLNGPTGSGKTSILDAVSFALYGKVPGARGHQLGDLRSHLADSGLLTEVVLEATIRGRRMRVTRQPRQDRPKMKGEGTTSHPASAVVQEWNGGDWETHATKPSEADPYLEDLIGLSADQFQQVILLPQGEFARFLRASANDRQTLLQAVFDTGQFSAVAYWLRDESARLGGELSELDTQLTAAFNECAGTLEIETPDTTDEARQAWLDHHDDHLQTSLDVAQKSADAASATVSNAVLELEKQIRLHGLQDRHRKALEDETALAEPLARLPELKERQRSAIAVQPIQVILEQLSTAESQRAAQDTILRERLESLESVRPDLVGEDDDSLNEARTTVVGDLTRLGDLVKAETDELPGLSAAADKAGRSLTELESNITKVVSDIDEMRKHLEEYRRLETDGAEAQKQRVTATAALTDAEQRLNTAGQREELRAQAGKISEELPGILKEAEAKASAYSSLLHQRIASISAELAESLIPGDPCPVCGSSDHPQPAQTTTELVTDVALNEALAAHNDAAQTATKTVSDLDNLTQRIEAITDAIGSAPIEEFELAHAAALARTRDLTERVEGGESARKDREIADREIAKREAEVTALREQWPKLDSARQIAQDRVEGLHNQLVEAADSFASVGERAKALAGQRDAIDEVLAYRHRVAEVVETIGGLRSNAEQRAIDAGFRNLEAAKAAMLSGQAIEEIQQQIDETTNRLTAIQSTLTDSEVIAATQQAPADPQAARENVEQLREAEREANDLVAGVSSRLGSLRRCREALNETVISGGPLRHHYDIVRNLARLANGEAGTITQSVRMSLVNYVLSAQLARVTAAASDRLSTMTNGRYTLLQTDEVSDGRAMGGLGIEVLDLHTSRSRGTRSLSGGESFMASLALALGLADVVAAEAGGVSLETLFIDEGFGTLDSDALNAVLDILDGLRTGGRAVGVVSHVTEMKERIPTHLVVQQVDRISHIDQSTAPA